MSITNEERLIYCDDLLSYKRRESREITIGSLRMGGEQPIRVQSMITSDTRNTEACVEEILGLAQAGCELVRITAQTRKYAENLEYIAQGVRQAGCSVPLVADIHFKPDAALEAAKWVEKIRINPGNYADKKKFEIREYSDDQYAEELARLREDFEPLVKLCIENNRAMRIGTNHGSLSDRIMNRYGDTPLGMCESALEFARIARDHNYHNFIFSMKASNPKVMIAAYRLLVARLRAEGADWNYPIHLGVTEAGDGEDGRIKSAVGIGSLLRDGIGDTIRVSLTEDAIQEIPVAKQIVDLVESPVLLEQEQKKAEESPVKQSCLQWDLFSYQRRKTQQITVPALEGEMLKVGGNELVRVAILPEYWEQLKGEKSQLGEFQAELLVNQESVVSVNPYKKGAIEAINAQNQACLVTVQNGINAEVVASFRLLAHRLDLKHSILLKDTLHPSAEESEARSDGEMNNLKPMLQGASALGSLLCDGIGDAVLVQGESNPAQSLRLAYNILQASGARIFKTDYVACPSCGRTLFNLQETTQVIRSATGHLKGVRIAIMGCIVNGPGEMADADFGYVGGAPGKINLYVGKKAVKFNIPEEEALVRLIDLIKEHGRWVEPTL